MNEILRFFSIKVVKSEQAEQVELEDETLCARDGNTKSFVVVH